MRISGTSEASVAFQWPLGSPPKIAAVCRRALVIVLVVAEARQRRVGVRGHQRRGHAPADLMLAEPAQQPRAARVRGLHLEGAVELDRMTDDLVREERVVVRVGDDDHVAVRGRQHRGRRELHALARQA